MIKNKLIIEDQQNILNALFGFNFKKNECGDMVLYNEKDCEFYSISGNNRFEFFTLEGIFSYAVNRAKNQGYSDAQSDSKLNDISVKDFVRYFVEPNTLVRLWHKVNGGHKEVIEGDKPIMEHELIKTKYAISKAVGVTDILYLKSHYIEALNLVIE